MAKYRITAPDGKILIVNGPDGATQEEVEAKISEIYKPRSQAFHKDETDYENMSWAEAVGRGALNLPASTARMVGDMWDAVTSPIETTKTVTQVIGGGVRAALNQIPGVDVTREDSQQKFDAVVDYFAEKYTTGNGFKKALAEDPAGILADISAAFSGGGTAVAKTVGTTSKVGKVAEKVASKAAAIDPLTATGKGIVKGTELAGTGITKSLAFTSGVGDEAIKQAYKAGREGGEALDSFTTNLRNSDTGAALQILEDAQTNLQTIKADRAKAYKEGMAAVSKKPQIMDFKLIDDIFNNADFKSRIFGQGTSGIVLSSVKDVYKDINDVVKQYRDVNANSLLDFDDMKRSINSLRSKYQNNNEALGLINDLSKKIGDEVKKASPEYAKIMKSYEEASELLYEIQHSLSLGRKKPAEVALKKLLSTMRNNVSTNYGQRVTLVEKLQEAGGKDLLSALAGNELSSVFPRGLRGVTASGGLGLLGAAGGLTLGAIPSLALSSPRLVGEAAKLAGSTARRTKGLLSKLPISKAQMLPPASGSYLAVLGRDYEEEQ
jgi:hypothetical protein